MLDAGEDPHVTALLARIREHPTLAERVLDGPPTDDTRLSWWISVYVGTPSEVQHRYTGPHSQLEYTFTTHSVGTSPAQARSAARMLRGQLTDHVLVVPGRHCHSITHPVGRPLEKDPDAPPALWFIADQFDFVSDPA